MKNEEKGVRVGLPGIVNITMGLLAGMVVIVTSALVSFWEPDEPAWTWKLTALFLLWAVAVWVKIIYKFKRDKDGRQENNGMLKVLLFFHCCRVCGRISYDFVDKSSCSRQIGSAHWRVCGMGCIDVGKFIRLQAGKAVK